MGAEHRCVDTMPSDLSRVRIKMTPSCTKLTASGRCGARRSPRPASWPASFRRRRARRWGGSSGRRYYRYVRRRPSCAAQEGRRQPALREATMYRLLRDFLQAELLGQVWSCQLGDQDGKPGAAPARLGSSPGWRLSRRAGALPRLSWMQRRGEDYRFALRAALPGLRVATWAARSERRRRTLRSRR